MSKWIALSGKKPEINQCILACRKDDDDLKSIYCGIYTLVRGWYPAVKERGGRKWTFTHYMLLPTHIDLEGEEG